MKHLIKQRGFLLVAIIVLIVVAGFYGIIFTRMIQSGASSNTNYIQAMQSYYVAEAGLNKSLFAVNSPNVQDNPDPSSTPDVRLGCTTLNNTNFGSGQFNISTATPKVTRTTLDGSTASGDDTINLTSTSGLSVPGRVYIGNEAVDYTAIGTCAPGNTPCISDVTRGVNGTVASTHDSGTYVSELACQLTANGNVPSTSNANGSTTLSAQTNMEVAFAGGSGNNSAFTLTHWNRPNNNVWTAQSLTSSASSNNDIYGIAAAGPDYIWAVGRKNADDLFTLLTWNAATQSWAEAAQPSVVQTDYRQNLNGVSAVSPKEAWAVGNRGGSNPNMRWTILRWNGISWCAMTPGGACAGKTIPNDARGNTVKHLRSVSVIDTNGDGLGDFGFAVGDNGRILEYDGTAWTQISSPTTARIRAVTVVSPNEAWACGDSGRVYRWNGSSWSQVRDFGGQQLYSVTALDTDGDGYANVGWVVGRQSSNGRAYRFTQSAPGTISWSTHNPSGGANRRLRGVAMLREGDAWAVGNNGRAIHWDGSTWTRITAGTTRNLFALALVGPHAVKPTAFRETFN